MNRPILDYIFGVLIAVAILSIVAATIKLAVTERKRTYIKTDRGLLDYRSGFCTLGMLTNNDGNNVYDENKNPITCDGYIKITKAERANYE